MIVQVIQQGAFCGGLHNMEFFIESLVRRFDAKIFIEYDHWFVHGFSHSFRKMIWFGKLFVPHLQFLVCGKQLFVGGFNFLLGGLEFFVECLKLFACGNDLLISRLQLLISAVLGFNHKTHFATRPVQFLQLFFDLNILSGCTPGCSATC